LNIGAGLLALVAWAGPLAAADPADPDWPCVQRLVPELTAGQMWSGPVFDPAKADPADQARLAGLAYTLASRTTPLEQAEQEVGAFAQGLPPQERNNELTLLFHGSLELINQERSEIIAGIKRYTRKQRRLAEKIAQDSRQLNGVQPGTTPDAGTQALLAERDWDLRIYEDRQKVLRQICEQPVLLDQRAFALARAMQARLEPN
jgi:hypothetical protein